jgi:hypothetical protein
MEAHVPVLIHYVFHLFANSSRILVLPPPPVWKFNPVRLSLAGHISELPVNSVFETAHGYWVQTLHLLTLQTLAGLRLRIKYAPISG